MFSQPLDQKQARFPVWRSGPVVSVSHDAFPTVGMAARSVSSPSVACGQESPLTIPTYAASPDAIVNFVESRNGLLTFAL
jgi:hypothetical protein